MKDDSILVEGIVVNHHRGDHYVVECKIGDRIHRVLAKRCGRLVIHRISIVEGDRVQVELSPYALDRGRILHRGSFRVRDRAA